MSLTPWPEQVRMCREVYRNLVLNNKKSCLIVSETGSGKTVTGSFFVKKMAEIAEWDCHVFAHRREIIHQTARKLEQADLHPGIIMDGEMPARNRDVQVCSVATYASWQKRGKLKLSIPKLIWIDEAHRAMSPTYLEIIDNCVRQGSKLILTTATPIRGDGQGLGSIAETMVVGLPPKELIALGRLVQPIYYVGIVPDMKGVKIVAGDYSDPEREAIMNQELLIGDVVQNWLRLAKGRPTMVFASGVEHSIALMKKFRAAGVRAVHIDGNTDTGIRDKATLDLANGDIDMICNAEVYIEGTDIPCISCIVDACPTRSLVYFKQKGGRGMRAYTAPDGWVKKDMLYLDHSGNVAYHGRLEKDRQWQLTTGKEMLESFRLSREQDRIERICQNCGYLYTGSTCLHCLEPYQRKGKEMAYAEGDLVEMTVAEHMKAMKAEHTPLEKQTWWQEMRCFGESIGKNVGWAAYCYKSKWKEELPNKWWSLPPIKPSEDVAAFGKKQLQNYARRMAYGKRAHAK